MIDLCIDTSGGISVAVVADGEVLARAFEADRRSHAEQLAVLVNQVSEDAGIGRAWDRVLVGTGPAPFTGLRAGLVTARVLSKATGAQLHGAPSLAALAAEAFATDGSLDTVTAIVDARRGELYWATYQQKDGVMVEVSAPAVGKTPELSGTVVGPDQPVDAAYLPTVVDALLAAGRDTPTEPLYLRAPDVHGK